MCKLGRERKVAQEKVAKVGIAFVFPHFMLSASLRNPIQYFKLAVHLSACWLEKSPTFSVIIQDDGHIVKNRYQDDAGNNDEQRMTAI